MLRMDKLSDALFSLCDTFEELSKEQATASEQLEKVQMADERLTAIEDEVAALSQSPLFTKAAKTLEESEEADALREKLRDLHEGHL